MKPLPPFFSFSPLSKYLFLLAMCCVGSTSQAQTFIQDSLLAEQYVSKAFACIKRNQADSAKMWHRQALDLFQKHNISKRWYGSYRGVADTLVKNKQPFVALEYLAPVIREKKSATRTTEESRGLMSLCMYSGFICEKKVNDLEGAKENYEQAFQLFVNDLGENREDIVNYLYHNLGNIYSRLGDYDSARELLQRGIDYGKRIGKPEIGKYGDLGIALNSLKRHEEALKTVQEGLAVPNLPTNVLITTRQCEAQTWLYLGEPKKALEAAEKAPPLIELLEDEKDKYNYLGGYHTRLGEINEATGALDSAIENYRKAAEFEALAWGANSREVGKNYAAMGECFFRKKEFENALQAFQQTLEAVLPDFQPQNVNENPSATLFDAENTIIQGLEGKARCFEALGNLDKALECYELIPSVEVKLLATHAFEKSSLLAVDASRPRFDKAIGLAWALYEKTKNIEYAQRAFHLTEQARGILLMKTIAQAQADYKLSDSVRRREYEFKIRLSWLESEIAQEKPDSERFKELENERFLLMQKQNRFRTDLAQKDPVYRNLSKSVTFRAAADVPRLLRPEQAFVNYYLTEDQTAYIFLVDAKGSLVWEKTDLPADFKSATIQPFIDYLKNGEGEGDATSLAEDAWLKKNAAVLYQQLLAPVLKPASASISALVIAPDDVLAFLPFELLQYKPSDADWLDKNFPFLLRKYSISYTYSATVLDRQQANMREHRAAERIPYAGFAPAFTGNERDPQDASKLLYPITETIELVEAVKAMLGGETFLGKDASESEFGRTAPLARVLLLAMHGIADEETPALSRLLFGNPQKSGNPDNVLYTGELQIAYLPADLVVLNACYTGTGKLHRGEGVYSVARALTSAGVPAAVMSVWELNGSSSRVLVELFFHNLKNGMPKDVALQKAKIALLDNPKYNPLTHPSFWAGMLATGDMSAMPF